jgi:uncharacterized protein YnzC (UPF0291/DUF896 family)
MKSDKQVKINYNTSDVYKLFSEKGNDIEIDKLLLNPIYDDLLVYAFLGAIKHNQVNYIEKLLVNIKTNSFNNKNTYIEPANIKLIFNCAIEAENIELINILNEQFLVTDTLKEWRYVRVDEKGNLEFAGFLPTNINSLERIKESYIGNPFLFGLSNSKLEIVELLLNKCEDIHPSVVENAFVESCDAMNEIAVRYLVENYKTRQIINNSKTLLLFLNEEKQLSEFKQKAKSHLTMMTLKDELGNNVVKDKPKLKM